MAIFGHFILSQPLYWLFIITSMLPACTFLLFSLPYVSLVCVASSLLLPNPYISRELLLKRFGGYWSWPKGKLNCDHFLILSSPYTVLFALKYGCCTFIFLFFVIWFKIWNSSNPKINIVVSLSLQLGFCWRILWIYISLVQVLLKFGDDFYNWG